MIVVLSDIHIPFTDKSFLDFADELCRDSRVKNVVLNGDIIDRVRCTPKDIADSPQGLELLNALQRILEEKKCYLVKGNHDPDLGKTLHELLGIEMPCYEALGVGPFLFMHGHQFDRVCSHLPWRWLKKIAPWFYRTPREWKRRSRKAFMKSVGRVWINAIEYAEKYKVKRLIIGHTHYPCVIKLETGTVIGDSGDWMDSCSCLKIVNGEISIVRYGEKRRGRKNREAKIKHLLEATKEAVRGEKGAVEIGFEDWRKARKKPMVVEFREPMFDVEQIHTREET